MSRRERQVMDILHRRGAATVAEVLAELPDPPSYSAVRSVLRILQARELVVHKEHGTRYVYEPAASAARAQREALRHVIHTFFDGSAEEAVTALLRLADGELAPEAVTRLRTRIDEARRRDRRAT